MPEEYYDKDRSAFFKGLASALFGVGSVLSASEGMGISAGSFGAASLLWGSRLIFDSGKPGRYVKGKAKSAGRNTRDGFYSKFYDTILEGEIREDVREVARNGNLKEMYRDVLEKCEIDDIEMENILENRIDLSDEVSSRAEQIFVEDPVDFLESKDEYVENVFQEQVKKSFPMLDNLQNLKNLGMEIDNFGRYPPVYSINSGRESDLNPYRWKDEAVNNFLEFSKNNLSGKKVNYIEKLFKNPEEVDEKFLEKRRDALPPQAADYYQELTGREMSELERVQEASLKDLTLDLYNKAQNRDEGFKEKVKNYESFLMNFKPGVYDEVIYNGNDYKIKLSYDPEEMDHFAEEAETCIYGNMRYFEKYSEDPYTLFFTTERNGDEVGYARSFIMRDSRDEYFLADDNFEVPNKEFEDNLDILKAQSLATMQACQDLNLNFVAGSDEGRVGRGPRQGYSNTKKRVTYEKMGENVRNYGFTTHGIVDDSRLQVIFENWRKF